jgi:hypothetical protein
MVLARLPDHVLDVERLAEPRIQLADADFDLGSKLLQCLDPLQHLASKLLLCSFRQVGDPRDRQLERFDHTGSISYRPCRATAGAKSLCVGMPSRSTSRSHWLPGAHGHAVAAQIAGCDLCKRIILHPDGSETVVVTVN